MGNLQLAPGSLFASRFEIQCTAGSGGMGTVYRAVDRYSGELVALKLLRAELSGPDESERFAREAQLLSELSHPGIVAYVAHGKTPDGQRFLAMEWLEGEDLGRRLAAGPLPLRDCLSLLAQIADALSIAHQRGIVHRDLKPRNLFLVGGETSRVKILDFGIARRLASTAMTRTGAIIGTPEYMSPEQARGNHNITPAADLFSLGCVLYECLTGRPPFAAEHIAAVLIQILFDDPVHVENLRPGVPVEVTALLSRLLAKYPEQRVADAAALGAELGSLGDLPERALADTMPVPKPKAESFAEQERSLFGIVLASPAETQIEQDATQPGSHVQLGDTDRHVLLQALVGLGGAPDFLANGSLVVTVPPLGSAQDQAAVAARAALLIKERWPGSLVSMAMGRGGVQGRTAVGEVVELAAQLLESGNHSSSGKQTTGVPIDPLSAKLLAGRFAQLPVPGGVLLLHEERDVDASRPLLGKPTPCVGREAELSLLEAQLSACIEESEARVILITAPPGAGKSRLRHEFLRRTENKCGPLTVLLGRGDMMSAGAPYGILRTAIHKLCGISGSEPLDTQRERLRTRITQFIAGTDAERTAWFVGELSQIPFSEEGNAILQSARRDPKIMRDCLRRAVLCWLAAECVAAPVLLVLDDLQWADELTISVLDEIIREQTDRPLFLLAFARPEVSEVFPRLWQSHKKQEVALKGLSKKACEQLVQQVLGRDIRPQTTARMVEQAGGNALFLEELIRALAEGQAGGRTDTVLAMLQARIGRLGTGARRAVRAASIFSRIFWRGGIRAILGAAVSESEIEHQLQVLINAELIQAHLQSRLPAEKEYEFRHDLIREAAYALLTERDLRTGHRLAGEFLVSAREQDASSIAEHFELSGDLALAARYYLRAAENSWLSGDYLGGLRIIDRGIACKPSGELRGLLRSVESELAFSCDLHQRTDTASREALEHLRVGSLGWCRAAAAAIMSDPNHRDDSHDVDLLSLLLSTEPDADAWAIYIDALASVVFILSVAAPAALLQPVLRRLEASVAKAEPSNPPIRRYLDLSIGLVKIFRLPGPWTLVQECDQAEALCRQAGDARLALLVRGAMREWGWIELGDEEGARRRLLALRAEIEQNQDTSIGGLWRHLAARALCTSAEESAWRLADEILAPMVLHKEGHALFQILAYDGLARLALRQGRLEEADAKARAAMALFSALPIVAARAAPVQIHALISLGRVAEAVAVAEQVLSATPMLGGFGVAEVEIRLSACEAFLAAGARERAHIELIGVLHQIQLRAREISAPVWMHSYLTRNPCCVRAQDFARGLGMDMEMNQ